MKSIKEYVEDIAIDMGATIPSTTCREPETIAKPTSAQFAVTLKQSIADMWTEHLDTHNYVIHMALDDYYQKAPEPVDGIIEALKSCSDTTFTVNGVQSLVCYQNWVGNPAGYLGAVRQKMYEARDGIWQGYHEVESMCDDLDKIIADTLYKINVLSKSMNTCPSLNNYAGACDCDGNCEWDKLKEPVIGDEDTF